MPHGMFIKRFQFALTPHEEMSVPPLATQTNNGWGGGLDFWNRLQVIYDIIKTYVCIHIGDEIMLPQKASSM